MSPERILPHSAEAEEQMLGALLTDGSSIEKVVDNLDYKDFYNDKNQWIYQVCTDLYHRDEPINQFSIAQELANRGKLEAIGGAAYLSYLSANYTITPEIKHHADTINKLAVMRRLISIGEQITTIGYNANSGPDEAIDQVRTLIDSIIPAKSKYLELSSLRILKSKPPHYLLNVNSVDLSLSLSELQQWGKFRTRILSELDFIPIKPKSWDATVNKLLEYAQKMEAPVDTSAEVETKLSVRRWFEQRGQGEEYSDIQSGCYAVVPYRGKETDFEKREFWAFQTTPLMRWLKRDLGRTIAGDSLWAMMSGWGAIKHQWRIGKSPSIPAKLWALPPTFALSAEFAVEEKVEQPELVSEEPAEEEELPDI